MADITVQELFELSGKVALVTGASVFITSRAGSAT